MKARKAKPSKTNGATVAPLSVTRGAIKEVDVIIEAGVPLGATFEFRNGALMVKSFIPNSSLPSEGVEVGMSLSHVDNEPVIGYEQPIILDLLRRRAHKMKVIKFTGLHRKFEAKKPSPEQGRMDAKYGLDALAAARNERKNERSTINQDADDDWRRALDVNPASRSSFGSSNTKLPSQNSPQGPSKELAALVSAKAPQKRSDKSSGLGFSASSSSGGDPFSTPARRRRIIADVSKFLLKQYCQKACKNVAIWRKQTAASLIIQRAWRMKYARLLVSRLRHRKWTAASIKIQTVTRAFLARKEAYRRRVALWHKRATHLALLLQSAWKERKMRIAAAKLRAERQARLMRRRAKMATEIQRVFRGMIGRRRAKALISDRDRFVQLRHRCAIKIQSIFRGFAARRLRYRMLAARARIGLSALMLYRRLWVCRRVSCRVIQRVVRGHLGRKIARLLRHERELARMRLLQEEERARLEARFQQSVREARQAEEDSSTKRADIRVTLNMRLLRHMAALGPAEVVRWTLENSIIVFDLARGYDLGSVLEQVFTSVLAAYPEITVRPPSRGLPSGRETDATGYSYSAQGEEKCVKVRSWNVTAPSAPPPKECYPNSWGQVTSLRRVDSRIDTAPELNHDTVGASVKVDRGDTAIRIVLTKVIEPAKKSTVSVSLTSPVTQLNTAEVEYPLKSEITIILESDIDEVTGAPAIITPAAGVIINSTGFRAAAASSRCDLDSDFKFKFRDAVVTIEPPQPISPVKAAHPREPEEIQSGGEDKGEIVMEDSFEDSDEEEVQPTVVKVEFVEPDLNPPAIIIQRAYKLHFTKRKASARRITGWLKTMRVLETWWDLVDEVLELAIENAIIIQKYIRRMLADRKVGRRRLKVIQQLSSLCERNSAFLLDDMGSHRVFLTSEANNWRTFGLEPDPSVPFVSLEIASNGNSQVQVQKRNIDNCGVIVAGEAAVPKRSKDVGTTIAHFVCSRLINADGIQSYVHPMQHLAASAYIPTPRPWDVYHESDLKIDMSRESADGTDEGEEEERSAHRAIPTLHEALAETRIY